MITGIQLITGLIGSGKTLRAVWYIDQEVKAGRAVYVANLNGINIPGVIPMDDPKQWQDLPAGSLLVVDEAQRFWRARRSGEPPAEIQAMETSRHDSVSFLLLTQQPTYLDKHLRGLVTRHEHLYRRAGAKAAQLFVWERCVDDPTSSADKDGADQSLFVYPQHLFGCYTSAEQHTVKMRLGARMKLAIAGLLVSVGLFAWVFAGIGGDDAKAQGATASAPGVASGDTRSDGEAPPVAWTGDWAARFKPRVEGVPMSAPAFDGRPVVSHPQLVCGIGESMGCVCFTEQGTRAEVDLFVCTKLVENGGAYDPYKQPEPQRQQLKQEGKGGALSEDLAAAVADL